MYAFSSKMYKGLSITKDNPFCCEGQPAADQGLCFATIWGKPLGAAICCIATYVHTAFHQTKRFDIGELNGLRYMIYI